jgi:hypothetical protein
LKLLGLLKRKGVAFCAAGCQKVLRTRQQSFTYFIPLCVTVVRGDLHTAAATSTLESVHCLLDCRMTSSVCLNIVAIREAHHLLSSPLVIISCHYLQLSPVIISSYHLPLSPVITCHYLQLSPPVISPLPPVIAFLHRLPSSPVITSYHHLVSSPVITSFHHLPSSPPFITSRHLLSSLPPVITSRHPLPS